MTIRTSIKYLGEHTGKTVLLEGWVYNSRSSGKLGFLMLRDGTGIAQCVVSRADVGDELFSRFDELTQESSLTVIGEVRADGRAPGGYEIGVESFQLHQQAIDYPIAPKEHGTAFLMDHRHLWLRSRRQHAIVLIRHEIIKATRDFLDNNDFILVDTPIITPNAVEGTTTLFEIDYFGQPAYLTQSGQLYNEANAMAHKRVYCFGPTFRAEKSKTRRHLTEFWMVEPEMAYCDLDENMIWAEKLIEYVVGRVLENRAAQLDMLERDRAKLEAVTAPFPRISYTEAVDILHAAGQEFEWGGDFGGGDETVISEQYDRPVIVHRFPARIKAFYMKVDAEDARLALGMDVLAPEGYGEIVGGGQREENLDVLLERLAEEDLDPETYQWYLDLRRYGSTPHAGFGMGIERVVAWICGLPHVRETIPYPRMLQRMEP
ncbi:MAG: asparagine--tRNA ligase [Candidatus Marinimicrobia bacterium]|nr:asparagine--tRNA ligase [Candidatus Neomarinimicrobiota bacterium]